MPAPVAVPQQSQISQLVTSQVDHEVAEMASQVAAQQAFQVMAQYEAATTDNVSTLGEFSEPPKLVVDTTPVTGATVRRSSGIAEPSRSPSFRSRSVSGPTSRSTSGSVSGSVSRDERTGSSSPREGASPTSATGEDAARRSSGSPAGTTSSEEVTPASATTSSDGLPVKTATSSFTGPDHVVGSPTIGESSTTLSSAHVKPLVGQATPSSNGQVTPSAAGDRNRKTSGAAGAVVPQPADRFSGAAVVPAARRPGEEDEPDEIVHESKYLLEADDIYGSGQLYSPPVIGESGQRR
jgi:hypothetical protein